MQPIAGGVLVVAGLIVAQGLLVLAEAALTGARKSLLKSRAARGDRGAEAAIRLGEDPRRFAPALQAGIILLGSVAGVYAGAVLVPILDRALERSGRLSSYRDAIGIGAVALVVALATLVIGELIPRRVALHRPEVIARLLSRPSHALAVLVGPLVGILGAATARALRIVGIRPSSERHRGSDPGADAGGDPGGRLRGGRARDGQAGPPLRRSARPCPDDPAK
jgi:putative hemolysin